MHIQARDAKELNVLETKAPSIWETWINNKEESKNKHKKLEDILEEEILDAQLRNTYEILDSKETKKEEDNKNKDNILEKQIY